ncbi:MAG TPA: hypothetical protein GXX57_06135 [Firmicutes bacterium]|nr:hypothetical protein [Bacillota bacterium]
MSDLVPVDKDLVVKLGLLNRGNQLIKPFSRDIFLVETHVAGTSYVKNIEQIVEGLALDVRLRFFREQTMPTTSLPL